MKINIQKKKIRPSFKIHGGKYYLVDFIVRNFPPNYENMSYLELFGGAASVLTNKKLSVKETYNDLHKPTANIFACLVNHGDEIVSRISKIEYKEEVFKQSLSHIFCYGSVDSAINEIVLRRMSRGGMKKHFSWSSRTRGGRPGDVNAWETFKNLLPLICDRLKNVEIKSEDALTLIPKNDDANTLIYLDPPYLKATRTAKKIYECELSDVEHANMAEIANKVKSRILISGYDSPLYRQLYKDWRWITKEVPNNSGQGKVKQRRVECLIMNY